MRLLADGATLGPDAPRLQRALVGLAARGHRVEWFGPRPPIDAPPTLRDVGGWGAVAGLDADLVLAGDRAPLRTAALAWCARADGALFGLTRAGVERWSAAGRWAGQTLHPGALVDESEAEGFARDPRGFARGRVGLWPSLREPASAIASHPDTEVLERACERYLAARRAGGPRPALFVDRDGTLIREVGYLSDPEQLDLLPGVADALRMLQSTGTPVIVISNQAGIGRGLYTEAQAHTTMARLRERLRAEGVELTAIYFCPHRPEDGCACRKPRAGLLTRAADDLRIDLAASAMVGDKWIDVAAGHAAGGAGVLVRTGYGREQESAGRGAGARAPECIAEDLRAAVTWFLARQD